MDIVLPSRPVVVDCPDLPDVRGVVTDHQTVEIPLPAANTLREYIHALLACSQETRVILSGHIEKLENRLKALGAK